MCRADVFPTYHTITQYAYGGPIALEKVTEPHWFVHGMWLSHSHENKQEVLYVVRKRLKVNHQDACSRQKNQTV
jgi:hypothetical protein